MLKLGNCYSTKRNVYPVKKLNKYYVRNLSFVKAGHLDTVAEKIEGKKNIDCQ